MRGRSCMMTVPPVYPAPMGSPAAYAQTPRRCGRSRRVPVALSTVRNPGVFREPGLGTRTGKIPGIRDRVKIFAIGPASRGQF